MWLMKRFTSYVKALSFEQRETFNHQVFLLDLTLKVGFPDDIMGAHTERIVCIFPVLTDCFWIWLIQVLMKRSMEWLLTWRFR